MKPLWLSVETTGFDLKYVNIVGLAYWPEIRPGTPCPAGPRYLKVQPVLHVDDQLYRNKDVGELVKALNGRTPANSPEEFVGCSLAEASHPLFIYQRQALSYQMSGSKLRDPAHWLLDRDRVSPARALELLAEDLRLVASESPTHERWTVLGYNAPFHLQALTQWVSRVLEKKQASQYLQLFNSFFTLDLLTLARWGQYRGEIKSQRASLKDVASSLGVDYHVDPEAVAQSELTLAHTVSFSLVGKDEQQKTSLEM